MMKFLKCVPVFFGVAVLASGCNFMPRQSFSPVHAQQGLVGPQSSSVQPAMVPSSGVPVGGGGVQIAGRSPAQDPAISGAYAAQQSMQMMHSQMMGTLSTLQERLQRIERAMIRLDRRMQLVERNELSRMSGQETGPMGQMGMHSGMNPAGMNPNGAMPSAAQNAPRSDALYQPMSYRQHGAQGAVPYTYGIPAPKQMAAAAPQAYGRGYTPVAYGKNGNAGAVTSSLQAAPQAPQGGQQMASARLPSLADKESPKSSADTVKTWLVNYENGKIWPSRDQLVNSRDVVSTLRGEESEKVTLFARGARTTSKEFRERVRALSRYLSRVSSQETVAISAMPAAHLEEDVIELIVTR